MRIIILLFGLLIVSQRAVGQPAPDFTVTDTDGQVHHLYADYLNQGKSVLIKIMFTTCPPCNSIAPLMEPFYQEWGAGDYDVEFFEMTDKSFDDNALMEAFANQYNETFPAISVDGNALATVQPYKNGTYGPWFGTPTFVVIAPDGTVQFNVDGANNQATIDALDAAIAATGAVKPVIEQPVIVSGQVQFLEGSSGVGNAVVQVLDTSDNIITADTTGLDGTFDLEVLLSEVHPGWKVKVEKDGMPLNGVSVLDLVRIQKHILFLEPFDNPYAKLASDVNKSGTISSLDIIGLLKIILGRVPNFSDGETWIVIPADTDFGPPTQNPPLIGDKTILLEDILSGARQPQWIGIKKGDANGNANPNQ